MLTRLDDVTCSYRNGGALHLLESEHLFFDLSHSAHALLRALSLRLVVAQLLSHHLAQPLSLELQVSLRRFRLRIAATLRGNTHHSCYVHEVVFRMFSNSFYKEASLTCETSSI